MKRSTNSEEIIQMAKELLKDDHHVEELVTDDLFNIIIENIYSAVNR
jgi:type III secretion system FlhB-like substrate exporter